MAGLLDLFGTQMPGGSGLFGNMGNFLTNNQDALIGLGLGLAGGSTPTEGFRYGLQGIMQGRQSDRERVAAADAMKLLAPYLGSPASPAAAPQAPAAPAAAPGIPGMPQFGKAIAGIESNGGNYQAIGPVTNGDRPFGKYQVMGANVGPWTEKYAGRRMTPQEFLASPEAQEAVFKGEFGSYVQKYGPDGAARAWFAGERGMNNPNAKDVLGTTVASYAKQFNAGLGGGQQPIQVAQAMPQQQGMPQGAPAATPPANPATTPDLRNVPMGTLFALMANQHLKGAPAELVKELFKQRLQDSAMTNEQKNYLWAKANGDKRSPADFMNAPSFGETGARDQYDRPVMGWRNPNTQSVTGASGQQITGNTNVPIANVTELRKEVQQLPSYKNITQAAPVYQSMVEAAGRDNRAADLNMVYGMAKLMDPGSVVREGEMSLAQAVSTLPQQLQASILSQLSGSGRLSPDVRQALMTEAHSRVQSYKTMFDQDAGMYRGILQRQRMNEADVLPAFGPFQQFTAPKAAPQPQVPLPQLPSGPQWMDMGNGVRIRQKQ